MSESDLNPYAAPERVEFPISSPESMRHRPSLLLTLAGLAYGGFTLLLLTASASGDVAAGGLFLINALWLVVSFFWSTRTIHKYQPAIAMLVAAALQLGIMALMLSSRLGSTADVIEINSSISGSFILLSVIQSVWTKSRTNPVPLS